jgi:hypothetical protein
LPHFFAINRAKRAKRVKKGTGYKKLAHRNREHRTPTLRDIAEHLTGEARGLGEIAPRVRPAGRAYIDDNIIKFLAGARDTVGRIPLKQPNWFLTLSKDNVNSRIRAMGERREAKE